LANPTIEEQLVTLLSSVTGGQIFPSDAGENPQVFPYLVYERQPSPVENVLNGNPPADNTVFVFNCWGRTHAEARAFAAAITPVMRAWVYLPVQKISDHDIFEADVKMHRVMQEWSVWVPA
jgi:hypothetical protein